MNSGNSSLTYLDWLWKTREFFVLPGLNVPMTANIHGRLARRDRVPGGLHGQERRARQAHASAARFAGQTFEKAAELAAELALKDDEVRWRRVLAELPGLSLASGGAPLIAPAYPLPASHRHFSHLMAIHPLGLIDWEQGDDARRTIKASLKELREKGTGYWCGHSYSWLGSLAARARYRILSAQQFSRQRRSSVSRRAGHVEGRRV